MVNGKIVLGTLSITAALVAFFELLADFRYNPDSFPALQAIGILFLATWGVFSIRNGMPTKRRTS